MGDANPWTPEQDDMIRQLWKVPVTAEEMARAVERSVMAVRSRVHRVLRLGDRDPAVLAAVQRKAHAHLRVVQHIKRKKALAARGSSSSHEWVVEGRVRACSRCGAKQYLSVVKSGPAIAPVWVCDAPPCRKAAA